MRPYADSDKEIEIVWFFVEPNAKLFPFYHRFASGNWMSQRRDWSGPGEVLGAPRRWVNGRRPGHYAGIDFCGPLSAFEGQLKEADDTLPAVDANGVPECCMHGNAGLFMNGSAIVMMVSGFGGWVGMGGAVGNGSAKIQHTFLVLPEGGAAVSGIALLSKLFTIASIGGLAAGGQASMLADWPMVPSGGTVASGAAGLSVSYGILGQGGVLADGNTSEVIIG